MNRIDSCFAALRGESRPAFIPFITAGDPSPEATVELLLALEQAGADLIELGVPYSDPLADGPTIQRASLRALENGVALRDVFALAGEARRRGLRVPLLLFTYLNPLYRFGLDAAFEAMVRHQLDGVIIPDLPHEENEDVYRLALAHQVHYVPMAAPTSAERVPALVERASGFVYCVSSLGVTGMRSELHAGIESLVRSVKALTPLPVVVGFGISSRTQYADVARFSDGVAVGSAIVQAIEQELAAFRDTAAHPGAIARIQALCRELRGETR